MRERRSPRQPRRFPRGSPGVGRGCGVGGLGVIRNGGLLGCEPVMFFSCVAVTGWPNSCHRAASTLAGGCHSPTHSCAHVPGARARGRGGTQRGTRQGTQQGTSLSVAGVHLPRSVGVVSAGAEPNYSPSRRPSPRPRGRKGRKAGGREGGGRCAVLASWWSAPAVPPRRPGRHGNVVHPPPAPSSTWGTCQTWPDVGNDVAVRRASPRRLSAPPRSAPRAAPRGHRVPPHTAPRRGAWCRSA